MQFAKRMEQFGEGIFSSLLAMKKRRLAEGKPVVDLSVGTPNIPPAPHIIEALVEAAKDEKNYIYAIQDLSELRLAAAQWYERRYQVSLDPETEILALLGSQDGLAHIALSILDEGDLMLVPDPCYPVFADGPKLAGAELYYMPQRKENGYIIDLSQIPEDVARRAKFMLISYPNNPTTVLAPDSFYRDVIAFAKKYDIMVLHDNAYSELVFDGASCGSFLQYPGAKDVGVEFNSLSKTYGMAGARVGFCLGNREMVKNLGLLKSNIDYGIFLPIQKAAIAALTGDQSYVAYERRRDLLCDGLTSIGWRVERCPATMFVWADVPEKFKSSMEFVEALCERAGVIVTPGSAFGPSGEGHVRMALVQDEDQIQSAVQAIRESGILL